MLLTLYIVVYSNYYTFVCYVLLYTHCTALTLQALDSMTGISFFNQESHPQILNMLLVFTRNWLATTNYCEIWLLRECIFQLRH
jgi:hypothetical protein